MTGSASFFDWPESRDHYIATNFDHLPVASRRFSHAPGDDAIAVVDGFMLPLVGLAMS
jgi:hypothetical protein